jgi:hypothetical protein
MRCACAAAASQSHRTAANLPGEIRVLTMAVFTGRQKAGVGGGRSKNVTATVAQLDKQENQSTQNCCANSVFEPHAELIRGLPYDMVVLPRVEVGVVQIVLSARPDHGPSETHREARLEIDALALQSHVRDDELRTADLAQNLIADLLIVVDLVDPDWIEAARGNSRSDAVIPSFFERGIERHRNEAAPRDTA